MKYPQGNHNLVKLEGVGGLLNRGNQLYKIILKTEKSKKGDSMDCSCIYINTDNGPEFSETTYPVARKTHRCTECYRDIKHGEKYEKCTGVWEGDFETYKTCIDCLSIRENFFCDGWQFTSVIEFLGYHIEETNGEISENCLVNLTVTARAKVCEMIEDNWRDDER